VLGGRAGDGAPGRADRHASDACIRDGSEGEADEKNGTGDSTVRATEPATDTIGEVATFLLSCYVSDIGVADGSFLHEESLLGYEPGWFARGGERVKSKRGPTSGPSRARPASGDAASVSNVNCPSALGSASIGGFSKQSLRVSNYDRGISVSSPNCGDSPLRSKAFKGAAILAKPLTKRR
jgi:hypothetical protein